MKAYCVSRIGRIRAAILLVTLAVIVLYAGRKALGLYSGITAKASDVFLFNLNLNTTVPAILLTLVALSALAVGWYLLVELITKVELTEGGLLIHAPGYRIFYRWSEVAALDVLNGPVEDAAVCLRIETANQTEDEEGADQTELEPDDEIAPYLSEAVLREDKAAHQRIRAARRQQLALIQARATRHDGRALPSWVRLLYPQARRPDRILLYPGIEDRTLLLTEIESHLAKV